MAAALSSSLQLQRAAFSSSSRSSAPRRAAARAPLAVHANAALKPPQGVTMPPTKPQAQPATFGFVDFAEKFNSRAAMIGFFALLAVEALAGKGILNLIGITTGKGLGFEF